MSGIEESRRYTDKVRAGGGRVVAFKMPCCDKSLDVHVPTDRNDEWTSLMLCPHCNTQWMSWKMRNFLRLERRHPDIADAIERHVLIPEKKVQA